MKGVPEPSAGLRSQNGSGGDGGHSFRLRSACGGVFRDKVLPSGHASSTSFVHAVSPLHQAEATSSAPRIKCGIGHSLIAGHKRNPMKRSICAIFEPEMMKSGFKGGSKPERV